MFNIINGEHLSFNYLIDFLNAGGSVLRTTHLGNQPHTAIFLSDNNIPVLLHEYLPGNHTIYKAGFTKLLNHSINISGNASCKNRLIQIKDIKKKLVPPEIIRALNLPIEDIHNVAQLHYESLLHINKSAFVAFSEFILAEIENARTIIELIANAFPALFQSFFDNEGREHKLFKIEDKVLIYKNKCGDEILIDKSDLVPLIFIFLEKTKNLIRGDNTTVSGIMMSNNVYIILLTLLDLNKKKANDSNFSNDTTVIHIAGIKMMDYLIYDKDLAKANNDQLKEIFSFLVAQRLDLVPSKIDFILFPTDWLNKIISCEISDINTYEEYLSSNKKIPWGLLNKEIKYQYDLLIKPAKPILPKSAWNMSQSAIKACVCHCPSGDHE